MFGFPSRVTTPIRLPEWFRDLAFRSVGVCDLFVRNFRVSCMLFISIEWGVGSQKSCVLRINNLAAGATLVKGRPSSGIGSALVNLFLSTASRCHIHRLIEYLGAKSICVDAPSRVSDSPSVGAQCI